MTESFLPRVNGVSNSVCRVMEHLARRGHEVLLLAPAPGPEAYAGFPARLVPGAPLPYYRSFAAGLPTPRVRAALRQFRPDVVHLASPVLLGALERRMSGDINMDDVILYRELAVGALIAWTRRASGRRTAAGIFSMSPGSGRLAVSTRDPAGSR